MINIFMHPFCSPVYAAAGDIVGSFTPPAGIKSSLNQTTSFISVIITLLVVVAGIFTLWQLITAGIDYINSSGDKTKVTQAGQKITTAIMGMVIIAGSFVIIALIGFLLYGDPGAFIYPTLQSI